METKPTNTKDGLVKISDYLADKQYATGKELKAAIIAKYGSLKPLLEKLDIPASYLSDLIYGRKTLLQDWIEKLYQDLYG